MKIIGIESASGVASVAIYEDGVIKAEYTTDFKKTHSETLLPMLDQILTMTGTELESVDGFAVSAGPGSFTGLRIGAAMVKGLADALDKPIVPVSTLAAMAYGVYGSDRVLCPLMDARRNQVYTGLYTFDEQDQLITHMEASALDIQEQIRNAEALGEQLGKEVLYLGCGLKVFKEQIQEQAKGKVHFADAHVVSERASSIATLGAKLFAEGKTQSAVDFKPIYLRKSQAVAEREEQGLPTGEDTWDQKGIIEGGRL